MDSGRRNFLLAAAVLAGPIDYSHHPGFGSQRFEKALRLPSQTGLMAWTDASKPLRLEASYGRFPIFAGSLTDLLVYRLSGGSGIAVNPILNVRRGDVLDVTLANRIGEDTTIHWHGLRVDERNDGGGMHPIHHGASDIYRFKVANRAGLYWYHPHPHDRTGYQIQMGMGSLLFVGDEEEDSLRQELGVLPGDTEIPLLIHDKQVDEKNRIRYSMGGDDWIGNRVLVNFTPEPVFSAKTCIHRFRLLNGSNARTYLLAFVSGDRRLPYTLIGTDGGLLDKPRPVTELFLAPAQRLDILVDFGKEVAGTTVMMTSLAYDAMENDGGSPSEEMHEHPGAPPLGQAMDLMKIEIKIPLCAPRRIPDVLSSMPTAPVTAGAPRKFRLHIEANKWLINGINYRDDMHRTHVQIEHGARETWEIRNDMKSMPHPMHLHGFPFRVLSRKDSPAQIRRLAISPEGLTPQDFGWLDTVLVWPGETVRIAIDFEHPFAGTQRYMFHCHNLEHEDQGMMLNVAVA